MNKLLLILLATFSFNVFAAVNLNTASKAELESINGIGPVKAQAILDYRKKNGDFKNVNDIDHVPGFGDATMQKIKGDVSVNGKTSMTTPVAKPATKEAKPAVAKEVKARETTKPVKAEKTTKESKPAAKIAKEEKPAKAEKAAEKAKIADEAKAAKIAAAKIEKK